MNKTQYDNLLELQKHFINADQEFRNNYDSMSWVNSIAGIAMKHKIGGIAGCGIPVYGDLFGHDAMKEVFGIDSYNLFYRNIKITYYQTIEALQTVIEVNRYWPETVNTVKPITLPKLHSMVDDGSCIYHADDEVSLDVLIRDTNQHLVDAITDGFSCNSITFFPNELKYIDEIFKIFTDAGHEVGINYDRTALIFNF
jgi:hypothetical protein